MPPSRIDPPRRSTLIAGAAGFAVAELAAGLLIGHLFEWGRAEALLFFAFRPWLLFAGAALVARYDWRVRLSFYAMALGLAGFAESLLLQALGGNPWAEMARGWVAGAVAVLVIDLLLELGRRIGGRFGQGVAAVLVALLLLVPGGQRPYERLALGRVAPRPAEQKPRLLLLSALPLVWGELGPFDPRSRPAAAYRALQQEFTVRPIDYADPAALRGARLLLVAQPRALAPQELVAIDAWVRGGGRVLILADPDLGWPTELPIGDPRRPPHASLLSPLLDHWGVRLAPDASPGLVVDTVRDGVMLRRLALYSPGRFSVAPGVCRAASRAYLASCAFGTGRALLVADADLLRDDLWAAPGAHGTERHARLADNPLVVAGWLDRLAGLRRERAARPVQWQRPGANRDIALALAALPILAAAAGAGLLRRRGS